MTLATSVTQAPSVDTRWTRSLERGGKPSHAHLREHVLAVHRDRAGFTESCAWSCRDEHGRNSYELLTEMVDPHEHKRILDLACGSGVLMELCQQRFGTDVSLVGVDMSADELRLARQRLPDTGITLHEGVAQDLHFIADGTIDLMFCHWALTLMDPVVSVLHEARRVLAENGTFAAIIDGDPAIAPGYADVHNLIYEWVQRRYPDYGSIELGDARVRTKKALLELAREAFTDAHIEIKSTVLRLHASPAKLAREAAGFFYASFVLPEPDRSRMLEDLAAYFQAEGLEDQACFQMPVSQLVIRQSRNLDSSPLTSLRTDCSPSFGSSTCVSTG